MSNNCKYHLIDSIIALFSSSLPNSKIESRNVNLNIKKSLSVVKFQFEILKSSKSSFETITPSLCISKPYAI